MAIPLAGSGISLGLSSTPTLAATSTGTQLPSAPTRTRTTTIAPAVTTSNAKPHSDFLSQLEDSTHLTWWQLLCVVFGGTLVVVIMAWAGWRTRRQSRDRKRSTERLLDYEEDRMQELIERKRRQIFESQRNSGRVTESWTIDDCDSSDSEIEFPRRDRSTRRFRPQKKKHRDNKRRSPDYSIDHRDIDQDSGRDKASMFVESLGESKDLHSSAGSQVTHSNAHSKSHQSRRSTRFRDSVFSTFSTMRNAAIKLRIAESKVKVANRLAQDEELRMKRDSGTSQREAHISKVTRLVGPDVASRGVRSQPAPRLALQAGSNSRVARSTDHAPERKLTGTHKSGPPAYAESDIGSHIPTASQISTQQRTNIPRTLIATQLPLTKPPSSSLRSFTAERGASQLDNHRGSPIPESVYLAYTATPGKLAKSTNAFDPAPDPASTTKPRPSNAPPGLDVPPLQGNEVPAGPSNMAGIGAGGGKWADRLRARRH